MSTLHTINKSPYANNSLTSCLNLCAETDGVLLLEDGVYGALISAPGSERLESLSKQGVKVFAVINDIQARGLNEKLAPYVKPIDYDTFVQLTIKHERVQSWY